MRLIHIQECDLEHGRIVLWEDEGDEQSRPSYVILSHRWGAEEVVFADVMNDTVASKVGFRKLRGAIRQALQDSHDYLWVDTCCIDKSSSAELSEAINSMWRYYRDAEVCYVYLADVAVSASDDLFKMQFQSSVWFTRGWTLQELLAPSEQVHFYNSTWRMLGDRSSLKTALTDITGIPREYLTKERKLSAASISMRMSWAARRQTKRIEDRAYSLLGIFGVSMPTVYGEGERSFLRLQEEIMRFSDDQTLFAWVTPTRHYWSQKSEFVGMYGTHGLLADSPEVFEHSANVRPYAEWRQRGPYSMTNKGLSIELELLESTGLQEAILPCQPPSGGPGLMTILLAPLAGTSFNQYVRAECHNYGIATKPGTPTSLYIPQMDRDPDLHASLFHTFQLELSARTKAQCRVTYADVGMGSIPSGNSRMELLSQIQSGRTSVLKISNIGPAIEMLLVLNFEDFREDERLLLILGTLAPGNLGFNASWEWRSPSQTKEPVTSSKYRNFWRKRAAASRFVTVGSTIQPIPSIRVCVDSAGLESSEESAKSVKLLTVDIDRDQDEPSQPSRFSKLIRRI